MSKTNTAGNAKLQYEAGQEISAMAEMTDSGDHKTFTVDDATLWSQKDGYEPDIRPDGLITGGAVTPGAAVDTVSVAAATCYLAGEEADVEGDAAIAIARPAGGAALRKIVSVIITALGAYDTEEGADGTSAFSSTRGAAGGPPLIPAGAIEVAQVKLTSDSSGLIEQAEIFQVPGSSQERYDYPVWEEDPFTGSITFASALPAIHAGSPATYKNVYAEVYEPIFADIDPVTDFVPPENTHSVSSTQVYGGTIGASSSSLGQGSFTAFLKDGVTDPLIALADQILFFKLFPDRNKTPYLLCQGKLGIARTFPAGDNIKAECTISASQKGIESVS